MKKTALITGCAKGIGKAIALELARNNYDIIGTFNTSSIEIEKLKQELNNMGSSLDYYQLDLTKEDDINTFCTAIKNKYNKINVLINNAAKSLDNEFNLKTKREFMEVLEVNLVAPFLLIQKLNALLTNGTIINISSTDGINTYSVLNMDYSASKAALINLTKSIALELTNINIYAICPNWVNTEAIQEMEPNYLLEEMRRVGQKKLIESNVIASKIVDLIKRPPPTGTIIRIDN